MGCDTSLIDHPSTRRKAIERFIWDSQGVKVGWPAWPGKPADCWWPGTHLNKFLAVSKLLVAMQSATTKLTSPAPPAPKPPIRRLRSCPVASAPRPSIERLRSCAARLPQAHRTVERPCHREPRQVLAGYSLRLLGWFPIFL